MDYTLQQELKRLSGNAAVRREMLLITGLKRAKTSKIFTVLSGVLALLSAGAITTVLVSYVGSEVLQIIAAITAAVSGLISLLSTTYFKGDETASIFAGASKYLALRDKAHRLLIHPNLSEKELYPQISDLHTEYAALDELYSQFYSGFENKLANFKSTVPDYFQTTAPASTQLKAIRSPEIKKILNAKEKEIENFEREVSLLNNKQ